jgi:hypothetical protein
MPRQLEDFMKKVFAVMGLAGVLAGGAQAQEATGIPRLRFDKLQYNFGTTSMVQSVTGTFTFQNVGEGVLEIRKPSTSCGCTVATVKPDRLRAGEKGELVFSLNLSGISRGHIEKHILVPSNDAMTPAVQLTIVGDLVSNYDIAPAQVSFGDVRAGTTVRVPIIVKRTDGEALTLGNTQASSEALKVQVENLPDYAGKAAKIWVEFAASGDARAVSDRVVIFGTNQQEIAIIPVTARIVGDVAVSPETVFWGITDPENWPGAFPEIMARRPVTVKMTNPDKTLEIRNPVSTLRELELSVVVVETGKVYDVVARLTQAPKETERGTITFETNLPGQPTIVVPVTINILRRTPGS